MRQEKRGESHAEVGVGRVGRTAGSLCGASVRDVFRFSYTSV